MSITRKIILYVMLAIGLLSSLFVAYRRACVESCNRAVDICLDGEEVNEIASASGQPMADVMLQMKSAGATSIAVSFLRFRDAVERGELRLVDKRRYTGTGKEVAKIARHLRMAVPRIAAKIHVAPDDMAGYQAVLTFDDGISAAYLSQLPLSLQQDVFNAAQKAGLEVIARIPNYSGAESNAVDAILADLSGNNIRKVIFDGDQVLGFKDSEKETAQALERHGMLYGQVEFSKQKGEAKIAGCIPGSTVVVHSITQAEMPGLNAVTIADRFAKAVRERGVRICYVRMLNTGAGDLLEPNADYVRFIARSVRDEGFTLSASRPLDSLDIPRPVRMLVGMGAAAGVLLLLCAVLVVPGGRFWLWLLATIVVCMGLAGLGETGRKLIALLIALVFPTLAALNSVRGASVEPPKHNKLIVQAAVRTLLAVVTVVCGGLLVMGMLSDVTFMLRINTFMGVKLAHLLPVLAIAGLFAGGIAWEPAPWREQCSHLVDRFTELGRKPVLIWQVAGGAAVLVLLALMVARSGNDSGLQVSPLELQFRSILDKVLIVRPRTKEFLVGYPLLLVGIAFVLRGRKDWGAPLVVVGSFGLISALNTFCHIHTPLAVSALRTFNGTVIGILLGLLLWKLACGHNGRK